MREVAYVVVQFVSLFLDAILLAMLVRAVLSWFPVGEDNGFVRFIYVVTEPVIMPVRSLCTRFGWFTGVPLDIPFFITTLLMVLISNMLQGFFGG